MRLKLSLILSIIAGVLQTGTHGNHIKKSDMSSPDLLIEKPGFCPDYPIYVVNYSHELHCPDTDICLGDTRCEGKKKCCPDQCGSYCKDPSYLPTFRDAEERDHPGFEIQPYAKKLRAIAEAKAWAEDAAKKARAKMKLMDRSRIEYNPNPTFFSKFY